MNLYEIDMTYKHLQDLIEQNDGELPVDLEEQFDAIVVERNDKIKNIIRFLRNIDGNAVMVSNEITRLQAINKRQLAKYERLKNYLSSVIGENNKWQSAEGNISWRKSDSVIIHDETLIPGSYVKTKTVTSIDKIAIKKAIKAGETVSGAGIEYHNNIQFS
jgi:hypothetical protein